MLRGGAILSAAIGQIEEKAIFRDPDKPFHAKLLILLGCC